MPRPFETMSSETRLKIALCTLRLLFGAGFLVTGYNWLQDNHFLPNLPSFLVAWADRNPFFYYQDFLQVLVIPHAFVFGTLLTYTHLALGFCLITGLAVRYAAPIGAFVVLNYYMAAQHVNPLYEMTSIFTMITLVALWIGGAGRCYGLEGVLPNISLPNFKTYHKPESKSKSKKRSGKSKSNKLNASDIQNAFKKIKARV